MEGFGWYTYEVVKRLVKNHPEHHFILFFDRPFDKQFIFGNNVTPVVLNPPARHPILFILWFEFAVYRALKKYKADVFFSPDGYLSLRSKIPQIATINDINFEHFPKDIPFVPRLYLRHFFYKFAKKAVKIITVSQTSKLDIADTYSVSPDKIEVAWNGVSDIFTPINENEKQEVKDKYTNGKSYFLFVGSLHPRKNLSRLIQAFEIFRKDNSDFDLVIVGEEMWSSNKLDSTEKEAIHFTGHLSLEDLSKVMASASVFTFIPYFEGFGLPLVEAMKAGVPILAGNLSCLPEVAGDAAVYCNPLDINDITLKMRALVKDEDLQTILIKNGIERSKLFSWDNSASIVWKEISQFL